MMNNQTWAERVRAALKLPPLQLRLFRCWHHLDRRENGTTFYAMTNLEARQKFAAMFGVDAIDVKSARVTQPDWMKHDA
jgi:hypothetical protein